MASRLGAVTATLTGCALLSAGCGARWDDAQKQAVARRNTASVAAARGGAAVGPGAASDAPADDAGATTDTSVVTNAGAATETAGPASAGSAAKAGAGAPATTRPCDAPSHEIGVTDHEITLGEISSLSGPVPGLGASSAAAVRAYVAQRNASGGACGRKLVLKEADDGTDAGRYRSVLHDLGPHVLAITGGFAVGDIGSEDVINELHIPIINSPTGRTGELPLVFDINPDFPKPDMLIGKYRYLYERGARKVSMTYIAVDQSRIEANIQRHIMEAAGLKVVHVNELPLSTLSYDSAARAAANSGADYLWFIADTTGEASMARSVYETHHNWLFKEFSYTSYGTNFIELAGKDAAEGVTSWIRSLPTEEAATNKAMGQYVEWMKKVAPNSPEDLFSIDSYVSVKAFVEALEALPGPISRDAVVTQLASIETYDAGGMFAPITLGKDLSKGCFMAMTVHDGAWHRLAPEGGGYLC